MLPLMNRRENAADINWSRNLPISMWTHIVLDDETGLVKHLLLNEVGLQADLGIELEPLLTPSLQIMQLIGNDVKGDIVWLGRAPNLQEVWLYMTSVTGDIKVFSKCRQIRIVGLYRTFAHGSIEIFRTTPKLEMLVAAESNIWGDISVFTHTSLVKAESPKACRRVRGCGRGLRRWKVSATACPHYRTPTP